MKKSTQMLNGILLCCSLLFLFGFIPRDEDPLDKLVSNLQLWRDSIPQEKIYLHTDKPYYALGDTIWFKGYLTIGSRHQLSALSGAMYVELISEKDSLVQRLKLPVTSGMVIGDFILKDDYHQGSYRIRAYTQWMRNAGEDYFYDHTFLVGDVAGGEVVAKADFSYREENGKQALTAILNYTNDQGKALGDKSVRYEIWANHKIRWQQNGKTDALGSLRLIVPDDIKQHPDGAYVHTILEGSDKYPIVRDFPVKANLAQSDVQFFPESGNLVNGIASRVAFKAVGIDGLGINIKGSIIDNDNKEVAKLETLHAGMGSFLLTPVSGKTYTAKVIFDDGLTKSIALPKVADEGYVLSVYQPDKDSVLVRIHASAKLQQSAVNLLTHTSGETIFATPVKIEKPITSIWLDKKAFPTGIAQFTLFDANGEPLNERIAFIRSNDIMQPDIKTDKTSYNSKEQVKVVLEVKDSKGKPAIGNFSVSVIDESKLPFDENKESTIFSTILLTSDLKGYVEQPNYYFAQSGDEVDKALDNLMLTQGYRRFTWKELNNTVVAKTQFPAEGLGTIIAGRVTTLNDKPVADANISLIALRANAVKSAITATGGKFRFEPFFLTDSIKLSLQARTKKGSDKVKLLLDSIPGIKINPNPNLADASLNIHSTLKQYIESGKKEDDAYEKLGMLDKVHRLKEVKIKTQKIKPKTIPMQGILQVPEESVDKVYKIPQPELCANLAVCLRGALPQVEFVQSTITKSGMTRTFYNYPMYRDGRYLTDINIIVDGVQVFDAFEKGDIFEDGTIDATDIVKIEAVTVNMALKTTLGGPSVLIFTNRGLIRKYYNPSIVNIAPKGFNKVLEFYSPRYNKTEVNTKQPDLRSTIYWNPYLKTGINGKTSFTFFNADGPGNYRVVIEGINAAGQLGRTVYHYKVNANGAGEAAAPVVTDKNLARITAPLDSFNKRLPVEKAYLQLDKTHYNLGDTLWFKAYVVNGANLMSSKISGLLYVELDNDSTEMVRRVSVPIKNGLAWAQIPLSRKIFREGGYTLRAYTNWMQNYGQDIFFNQRFYLGAAMQSAWLVNANAGITRVADKDQLDVELKLNHPDKYLSPVALKKVEVKIFDEWHYLYKENLQTGIDGSLKFSHKLDDKADARRISVQLTSLDKADGFKDLHIPLTVNRNQHIDLQFLPEGGNLVAGLNSVVGFKAIGEDGNGTAVLGGIYDSKNNLVVSFSPLHDGMGSFLFTPHAGETYTARISQPIAKTYPMPKIQPAGSLLHIYNPERGADLKVDLVATSSILTGDSCYLIGASKGIIYYSQKVDPSHLSLSVAKDLFPTGVARFTLFKGITPLNERAVFIDNADLLQISIKPNKTTYKTRDSVSLDILVQDKSGMPAQGNFSLAVTDNSQIKPDSLGNYGIASGLLLNSALKGNIESPGYYINRKDKQAWQALDNLMLTQGWTGYDWKEVFAPATPVKFKAEKNFKITGTVTMGALKSKPAANIPVLLSSQKPQFTTLGSTDGNGRFEFKDLPQIDSGSFFLQANNKKGKQMISADFSIDRFTSPDVPETLRDPVLPWYVNTDSTQVNYINRKAEIAKDDQKLTGNVLKEVTIKKTKIIKDSFFGGRSNLAFDEQDIKESGTTNLYELLKVKVPGFKIIKDWKYRGGAVTTKIADDNFIDDGDFFIDYVPIRSILHIDDPNSLDEYIEQLSEIKITKLEGLEVTLSRSFPLKYRPYYYAKVVVTTLDKTGWFNAYKPGTTSYRPLPILHPQQFYSPKYTAIKPIADKPDYRSTLFWEPNINTDVNGHAKVSFYTSDIKSSYTVKISGIDANGSIGDKTIKFNEIKN